jgi:hypothetical protein
VRLSACASLTGGVSVAMANAASTWGGLIVHALAELGEFREQISLGIQQDVRIGIDQQVFNVPSSPALRWRLDLRAVHEWQQRQSGNADVLATQLILRALGVDFQTAADVTAQASHTLLVSGTSAAMGF